MAKRQNYGFEKRQKDLKKQQKRDEAAAAYAGFLARAPRAFAPQIVAVQKRLGAADAGTR